MDFMEDIETKDVDIFNVMINELNRGRSGLEMIASENYVSKAVLQATGSVLTNKYSEGYPNKRYYSGNEFIDIAEQLAIDRAKKLFNAEFVNVQSHSGATANLNAYMGLLDVGDKVLAMSLDHGGHLSHGHSVNATGRIFKFAHYGVDNTTHLIDMEVVRKKAKEFQPKLIVAGFSAYSRELDWKQFREIADDIGAMLLGDIAHIAGLVAVKEANDPVPYADIVTTTTHKTLRGPRGAIIMGREDHMNAINRSVFPGMQGGPLDHVIAAKAVAFKEAMHPDFKRYIIQVKKNAKKMAETLIELGNDIVSGGTDNHLLLLDITKYNLGGKIAEHLLDGVGLYCNKNTIPNETRTPFDPSGLRFGTPALTTRGLVESDFEEIANLINQTLINNENKGKLSSIRESVMELSNKYPLYPDFDILR
jgi:glycine hydroxymethyltransferase